MTLKELQKLCKANGVPLTARGVNRRALESRPAAAALGRLAAVEIPIPPSTNNLFPTGADGERYTSPAYRKWKRAALPLISLLCPAKKYPVEIWLTLAGKGVNQQRDIANFEKAVGDALVAVGVIKGDSLPYVCGTHQVYRPDAGPQRVIVQITTRLARAPR